MNEVWNKRYKTKTYPKSPKIKFIEKDSIIKLIEEGLSFRKIALLYNTTHSVISSNLRRQNVKYVLNNKKIVLEGV